MTRKAFFCAIIITLTLSSCGTPSANPTPQETTLRYETPTTLPYPTFSALSQYILPPYYSEHYINLIETSKQEKDLIIHSDQPEETWRPVLEGFHFRYPWINIMLEVMGSSEVFDRYATDTRLNQATADVIVSSDTQTWQRYSEKGEIDPYISQEDAYLPQWSKLRSGLYTISSDPVGFIYNTELLPSPPDTMRELLVRINSDPDGYQRKIAAYDIERNTSGFTASWYWIKYNNEIGWEQFTAIGLTKPTLYASDKEIIDAVGKGKSKIGLFVPQSAALARMAEYPKLDWTYIKDGQLIRLTAVGITQRGAHHVTAKLFTDYLLSQEGQLAISYGGLMPYRTDVFEISEFHFEDAVKTTGEQNIIFMVGDTDTALADQKEDFLENWKTAFGKQ